MRHGGDNGHGAPASGSPIELSCMYSEARDGYKRRFDRLQLMEPELYSRIGGEGRTATGLAGTTTDREGVSVPIDEYNMHAMIDAPTRPLSLFIYMPGLNIYSCKKAYTYISIYIHLIYPPNTSGVVAC